MWSWAGSLSSELCEVQSGHTFGPPPASDCECIRRSPFVWILCSAGPQHAASTCWPRTRLCTGLSRAARGPFLAQGGGRSASTACLAPTSAGGGPCVGISGAISGGSLPGAGAPAGARARRALPPTQRSAPAAVSLGRRPGGRRGGGGRAQLCAYPWKVGAHASGPRPGCRGNFGWISSSQNRARLRNQRCVWGPRSPCVTLAWVPPQRVGSPRPYGIAAAHGVAAASGIATAHRVAGTYGIAACGSSPPMGSPGARVIAGVGTAIHWRARAQGAVSAGGVVAACWLAEEHGMAAARGFRASCFLTSPWP